MGVLTTTSNTVSNEPNAIDSHHMSAMISITSLHVRFESGCAAMKTAFSTPLIGRLASRKRLVKRRPLASALLPHAVSSPERPAPHWAPPSCSYQLPVRPRVAR